LQVIEEMELLRSELDVQEKRRAQGPRSAFVVSALKDLVLLARDLRGAGRARSAMEKAVTYLWGNSSFAFHVRDTINSGVTVAHRATINRAQVKFDMTTNCYFRKKLAPGGAWENSGFHLMGDASPKVIEVFNMIVTVCIILNAFARGFPDELLYEFYSTPVGLGSGFLAADNKMVAMVHSLALWVGVCVTMGRSAFRSSLVTFGKRVFTWTSDEGTEKDLRNTPVEAVDDWLSVTWPDPGSSSTFVIEDPEDPDRWEPPGGEYGGFTYPPGYPAGMSKPWLFLYRWTMRLKDTKHLVHNSVMVAMLFLFRMWDAVGDKGYRKSLRCVASVFGRRYFSERVEATTGIATRSPTLALWRWADAEKVVVIFTEDEVEIRAKWDLQRIQYGAQDLPGQQAEEAQAQEEEGEENQGEDADAPAADNAEAEALDPATIKETKARNKEANKTFKEAHAAIMDPLWWLRTRLMAFVKLYAADFLHWAGACPCCPWRQDFTWAQRNWKRVRAGERGIPATEEPPCKGGGRCAVELASGAHKTKLVEIAAAYESPAASSRIFESPFKRGELRMVPRNVLSAHVNHFYGALTRLREEIEARAIHYMMGANVLCALANEDEELARRVAIAKREEYRKAILSESFVDRVEWRLMDPRNPEFGNQFDRFCNGTARSAPALKPLFDHVFTYGKGYTDGAKVERPHKDLGVEFKIAPASTLAHAAAMLKFTVFESLCAEAAFVADLEELWRATRTMLWGLMWSADRRGTWEKLYHYGREVYRHHPKTMAAILNIKVEAKQAAPDTRAEPLQRRLVDFFGIAVGELDIISVSVPGGVEALKLEHYDAASGVIDGRSQQLLALAPPAAVPALGDVGPGLPDPNGAPSVCLRPLGHDACSCSQCEPVELGPPPSPPAEDEFEAPPAALAGGVGYAPLRRRRMQSVGKGSSFP
jgi:hypothetical protein